MADLSQGSVENVTVQDISLLENILEILEAEKIPANPLSPEAIKLQKNLEKVLAYYFKSLEQSISIEELEKLYWSMVNG